MTLIEMPFVLIVLAGMVLGTILGWQLSGIIGAGTGMVVGLAAGLSIDFVIVLIYTAVCWVARGIGALFHEKHR